MATRKRRNTIPFGHPSRYVTLGQPWGRGGQSIRMPWSVDDPKTFSISFDQLSSLTTGTVNTALGGVNSGPSTMRLAAHEIVFEELDKLVQNYLKPIYRKHAPEKTSSPYGEWSKSGQTLKQSIQKKMLKNELAVSLRMRSYGTYTMQGHGPLPAGKRMLELPGGLVRWVTLPSGARGTYRSTLAMDLGGNYDSEGELDGSGTKRMAGITTVKARTGPRGGLYREYKFHPIDRREGVKRMLWASNAYRESRPYFEVSARNMMRRIIDELDILDVLKANASYEATRLALGLRSNYTSAAAQRDEYLRMRKELGPYES